MNRQTLYLVVLVALLAAVGACAPKAAPIPASAPVATPTTLIAPTAAVPALSTEEAAWQKVVEAAKKEGKITAYDYFLVGDIGQAIQVAFEKRYGIKLAIVTGRGAEFIERLKTERRMGQMTGDYVSASTPHNLNIKNEGLTESVVDRLPELRDDAKFFVASREMDPAGHILSFNYKSYDPYINTKLVKPDDAPKSLRDFLNPKWKGKIISLDPVVSSGEYIYWVPLLNRGIVDRAYLKALGEQRLINRVSARGSAEALARGEGSLHTPLSDGSFAPFALEGAPIKAIPLEEGSMAYTSSMSLIKNAPHSNAALLYLNWRMGQEGQTIYSKVSGDASVRKDVQDFRPLNVISGAKIAFVATGKDLDDAGKLFLDKMLAPLLKP